MSTVSVSSASVGTAPVNEGARIDPASWRAPVVGVLGGLGPAATAVFLDLLVRVTDAATDQDHLDVLVSQHSTTPDRTAHILDPSAPDPGPVLARDAAMLERAGVGMLVLPCNTAHHYVRGIREATTVPFVSIVDVTADAAIERAGADRPVAVFATEGNIRARVYQEALEARGVEALVPGPDLQARISEIIFDRVKAGRPVEPELFEGCIDEALALGAGTVVLGCTELSVVHDRDGYRTGARPAAGPYGDAVTDSLTELAHATVLAAGGRIAPGTV